MSINQYLVKEFEVEFQLLAFFEVLIYSRDIIDLDHLDKRLRKNK